MIMMATKYGTGLVEYGTGLVRRLRDEEDGLALTEYLILLGLLTAAVILAVTAFGTALGNQWGAWATWIAGLKNGISQ
jgi:pilus assembly protein Flp/PilA